MDEESSTKNINTEPQNNTESNPDNHETPSSSSAPVHQQNYQQARYIPANASGQPYAIIPHGTIIHTSSQGGINPQLQTIPNVVQ